MRTSIFLLATLGLIEGCSGTPGTDGNTDGANLDTAPTHFETTLVVIETSILGEPEACAGTVEQDGEEINVTTGDPNSQSTTKLPVFLNKPFTVKPGNKSILASDGSYLHVKNIDGVNTFWYSPEIEEVRTEKSEIAYVIEAPMALHLQGDNVFCRGNSWWLDENAPDHKGELIGSFEEGPFEIIVSGYAGYTYFDEEIGEEVTLDGAQILVNGEFGGTFIGTDGGELIMVDDIIFFQPEEDDYITLTYSFASTEEMELHFEDVSGITEATCYNFDASR